jgi:excisionase family DNA binding protein
MKTYIPEYVSVLTSTLGPVIDVRQVAALLGCHTEDVERLAESGHLPGHKYGSDWVFVLAQLLRHMDGECAKNLRAPACPGPRVARARQGANTKVPFTVYLDPHLAVVFRTLCERTGLPQSTLLCEAVCLLIAKYEETPTA